MKKVLLWVVLAFVIIVVGYFTWQKIIFNRQPDAIAEDNSSIIFFYGQECPHCQEVEKYIAEHQLDQKVTFSKREVYHNRANVNLLIKREKECNLDEKEIGAVPMLWSAGKCYVGGNEVENFLDKAAQ